MDKILENPHAWVILNGEQFFLDSILLFVFNFTKWFSVKMYPIFGELLTYSLAFQPINTIHHLLLPHETGANVTSFPGSLGTRLAQTISRLCDQFNIWLQFVLLSIMEKWSVHEMEREKHRLYVMQRQIFAGVFFDGCFFFQDWTNSCDIGMEFLRVRYKAIITTQLSLRGIKNC